MSLSFLLSMAGLVSDYSGTHNDMAGRLATLALNGTVRNQNQKRGSDLFLLTFRNFVAHSSARLR